MNLKHFKDFDLHGKKVILRADLNVPAKDGVITDPTRIERVKPTIDALKEAGAKILVISHFDRPKGKVVPEMSLAFLTEHLQRAWDIPIQFSSETTGDTAIERANSLQNGEALLLENLRFHVGEEANDTDFAKALAALGDFYINDAFSASHRAHASTEGITHFLPSAAGMMMAQELNALNNALENPTKPVMAVIGGSKISTKLGILKNIVQRADYLVLGGAMANTFVFAKGGDVGNSMCEKDMAAQAIEIINLAKDAGCEIILPIDSICVNELAENADWELHNADHIPESLRAVDIGPASIDHIQDKLKSCKTVLWNGPLGVFEIKPFDKGTNDIAQCVGNFTKDGTLLSVAGGGDTTSALENAGALENFTYVSSAGGAFLEWLEGKVLPGVAPLYEKDKSSAVA